MASLPYRLGDGADISKIPFSDGTSRGNLTTCIGSHIQNDCIQWFQYKTPSGRFIDLCEYCARTAFKPEEVESMPPRYTSSGSTVRAPGVSYQRFHQPLHCSFASTNHGSMYTMGCQRRAMFYNGLRVNVNIIDKSGNHFRPTSLMPGSDGAAKDGIGIFQVPSHRYYEICVTGENREDCDLIFLESGTFDSGEKIVRLDKFGKPYFSDADSGMIINSFRSGDSSSRFAFIAPCDEEKESGLVASCHNKSNVINLTIGLYKKAPEPEPVVKCIYRGGESVTRGGAPAPLTRGGGPVYRGSPVGGSTLAAEGNSTAATTTKIKPPIKLGKVHVTIQLVSTEDNSHRRSLASKIQQDVEVKRSDEMERLRLQLEALKREQENDARAKLAKRSHLLHLN